MAPLVIELVGPAGAGKSALSRALDPDRAAVRASIWSPGPALLFAHAARLTPVLAGLARHGGSSLWPEMKRIVRLDALPDELARRRALRPDAPVILDEGPVFGLAWLRVVGDPRALANGTSRWWRATLDHWSRALDAVVVLDAPNPVLTGRIRGRAQRHPMRDRGDDAVHRFLDAYRAAFDAVLAELRARRPIAVVRLRTDDAPPDVLAERATRALAGAIDG